MSHHLCSLKSLYRLNSRVKNSVLRKRRIRGFSFVEMMVAVAILSFGIVFIYRALFISLDYLHHITYRLYAQELMDNKIADVERIFHQKKTIPFSQNQEKRTLNINNRKVDFVYTLNIAAIRNLDNIYQLDVSVSWPERNRHIKLSRLAYIANLKNSQDNP